MIFILLVEAAPIDQEESASLQNAESNSSNPTEPAADSTTQKGKYKKPFLTLLSMSSMKLHVFLTKLV